MDFRVFSGLPHLITLQTEQDGETIYITDENDIGIVKDKNMVLPALNWAKSQMDARFKMLAEDENQPANIAEYNQFHRANPLFRIVIIFDEYGAITDHEDGATIMIRIIIILPNWVDRQASI